MSPRPGDKGSTLMFSAVCRRRSASLRSKLAGVRGFIAALLVPAGGAAGAVFNFLATAQDVTPAAGAWNDVNVAAPPLQQGPIPADLLRSGAGRCRRDQWARPGQALLDAG